jgi:hypothetical protein
MSSSQTKRGTRMTDVASSGSSGHPDWDAFSRRHAGNLFLKHDPLYALTEPLIESIKQYIPDFFSADEEQFERDLSRTASFGFFLHRPLGSTAEPREHGNGQTLNERQQNSALRINQMLAEELRRTGANREEMSTYFEQRADQRETIVARQDAYAGWLVLNREYRDDVCHFREAWEPAVRAIGRFPRLPMRYGTDPTDEVELPSEFRDACYDFFCLWGLETLATWDWPVPMEPDLDTHLRGDLNLPSASGMLLFIPWYLLRGNRLDLRKVVQQSRLASAPDHLLDWVNRRADRRGGDLGDVRYATIRWLYCFDELVLARRYSAACEGNRQRLDLAFADVIDRDEDTVKKLRREIRRELGTTPPDESSA